MCHQQSAPLPFRLGGEVMRCPQALLVALLTHAHTAFAAPLWQRPAGEPPWAAGRATQLAAGDDGAAHRFVVTTRSDASLDAVHAACNHTGAASTGHACAGLLSGLCRRVFTSAVTGFAGSFTPRQLRQMHACAPDVLKLVEHDAPVTVMAAPTVALPTLGAPTATLWSLDRIDQAQLPLDGGFATSQLAGQGVHVYVVDSGVRGSHTEFASPPSGAGPTWRVTADADFTASPLPFGPGVQPAQDCDGHGTHVAGTVAGSRVGIARGARVHSVRVLDCTGSGSVSDVVAGIDYVAKHAQLPAVTVLSLGVPAGDWSVALETAVRNLVVNAGVFVTAAAGNSQGDACSLVPASVPQVFAVGGSDLPAPSRVPGAKPAQSSDTLYSWTDTGSCLALFAPGVDIISACGGPNRCGTVSDTAYAVASGTSMAAPHVAGAAAVYLSAHPTASPAQVRAALLSRATRGTIASRQTMLPGTPNALLLYSWALDAAAGTAAVQTR